MIPTSCDRAHDKKSRWVGQGLEIRIMHHYPSGVFVTFPRNGISSVQ